MDPLIWSVLCCVLMVFAIVLEMFTPSFGLLTIVAVGLLCGSVALGFQSSPAVGFVMTGVNLTLFPTAIYLGMQMLKRSNFMLKDAIQAGASPAKPEIRPVHELVGQQGTAITVLRPSGTAQIGEKRMDVVTEGKFVEAGKAIKVIKIDGGNVIVEPMA